MGGFDLSVFPNRTPPWSLPQMFTSLEAGSAPRHWHTVPIGTDGVPVTSDERLAMR